MHADTGKDMIQWMEEVMVLTRAGQKVFKIPVYLANRAIASKLVEAVDISIDKNSGEFKTSKQWVKFVNNSRPLVEHALGSDF